ncbi:hypothetical protein O6P43_029856 [Quillaja saponaria]|uniref:Uncharacterized protein n=1 Tax=Quillaja saponaria TaxID=32244 RepID=A0AAD7PBJ1_QUISA|nr:hypothetical protein O6P43_029856 [Quillaja saponaria]
MLASPSEFFVCVQRPLTGNGGSSKLWVVVGCNHLGLKVRDFSEVFAFGIPIVMKFHEFYVVLFILIV